MKKQMMDFVRSLGGTSNYCGYAWPSTLYIDHASNGKDWMIEQMIKRFGRHTQIKFE